MQDKGQPRCRNTSPATLGGGRTKRRWGEEVRGWNDKRKIKTRPLGPKHAHRSALATKRIEKQRLDTNGPFQLQ